MRSVTPGFLVWLSVATLSLSMVGGAIRLAAADEPAPVGKPAVNSREPAAAPSLESLLIAIGFDYVKKPNGFEIISAAGEDSMLVYASEGTAYTDGTGKRHKIGVISSVLLQSSAEKTAKPAVAMFVQMSVMNDKYDPGKLIFVPKTGAIVYESSFWLASATPETLRDELVCAFLRRKTARTELGPYLKDE